EATGRQLGRLLRSRALYNDKAAVFGRQLISDPDRLRGLVEADQSPLGRKLGEYRPAVASPAEGAVYIEAVRPYCEPFQRFAQQYTDMFQDRKSTRLNSSHVKISYADFCF